MLRIAVEIIDSIPAALHMRKPNVESGFEFVSDHQDPRACYELGS